MFCIISHLKISVSVSMAIFEGWIMLHINLIMLIIDLFYTNQVGKNTWQGENSQWNCNQIKM